MVCVCGGGARRAGLEKGGSVFSLLICGCSSQAPNGPHPLPPGGLDFIPTSREDVQAGPASSQSPPLSSCASLSLMFHP